MKAAVLTVRGAVAKTARDNSIPTTEHSVQSVRVRPIARPVPVCRWHHDGDGQLICHWEPPGSSDAACRSAAARSAAPITSRTA